MSRRHALQPILRPSFGFTLLELLVAMSLLALLVVMLMSMVDGATKLWRQNENRVDSFREARAALNVIAEDLSNAVISTDPNLFQVDPAANTLKFITATSPSYQDTGGEITNPDSAANKSNLCEVSYALSYERPNPLNNSGPVSYNLFRTFTSSTDTFTHIRNATLFQGGTKEAVARNVVKFSVKAVTLDPLLGPKTFVQSPLTPMPDMLEISITALNNEAVKRFDGESDWKDNSSATYKQNVRTFTTSILLPAQASKTLPGATPTPAPAS